MTQDRSRTFRLRKPTRNKTIAQALALTHVEKGRFQLRYGVDGAIRSREGAGPTVIIPPGDSRMTIELATQSGLFQ